MFDTMTLTKIVGGFCGAFLVFLLGGYAAESIYTEPEHHGEGEEVHQAYVIPVEGGETEAAPEQTPEEAAAEFQEAFAAADPAAGEGEFRPCSACHSLAEGDNRTGPTLHGVVDRPVDAVAGFDYSGALAQVGEAWTPEALNHFLASPKDAAPGTKMNFAGIKDVQDRANLIAYLASNPG